MRVRKNIQIIIEANTYKSLMYYRKRYEAMGFKWVAGGSWKSPNYLHYEIMEKKEWK